MVEIRMAKKSDALELLNIYKWYVENTAVTFEYVVPNLEEFEARIEKILSKYPYLVYVEDGVIIGFAYASQFKARPAYDWGVETTIYLKNNSLGKKIGEELYLELENRLKKQGITNMNASIAYPNPRSIKFHDRLGYKKVAHFNKCGYKSGKWYDMIYMEKIINTHSDAPKEIINIKDLI